MKTIEQILKRKKLLKPNLKMIGTSLRWMVALALPFTLLFTTAEAEAQVCSGAATAHVRLCSVTKSAAPLLSPATHAGIGKNFQGPSVIRVPNWVPNRLGNYYMYFAAHNGSYIRLAYANSPMGPWTNYAPGSLRDTQVAPFSNTIASPDLHIFDSRGVLRMYFHTDSYPGSTEQWSGVAESTDGINFSLVSTQNIAKYYMRVFQWAGSFFGLQKGWSTAAAEIGVSSDGVQRFSLIKTLSQGSVRHMGVLQKGNILLVFYSRIADRPERIFLSTIDLSAPQASWDLTNPIEVLRPTLAYEGANYPLVASVKGPATNVNEVRDPFVFEDAGKTYLYYTVAGESGIAVAQLEYELLNSPPQPPADITTVSLTANGSSIVEGSAVNLSASVSVSAGASVAKVEFFDGAVKLGEDLSAPFSFSTSSLSVGAHSLMARATSVSGFSRNSANVAVTITPRTVPGTISVGSRVRTKSAAMVYPKAKVGDGGSAKPVGAAGIVTQGPTTNAGTWWRVDFDTGADGWILENSLEKL